MKSVVKLNVMIEFRNIDISLKPIIDRYYCKFGEGSCQHSFATSFCLKNKYNDMFAEKDDVLYILRDGISNDKERIYLFPMCDRDNIDKIKKAIIEIIDDAHYYNKKVKFQTITKANKDLLSELYKDLFVIEDCRDLYEYIYSADKIANLAGSQYQSKRNIINKLYNTYSNMKVKIIDSNDNEAIKKLYLNWIDNHFNVDEHVVNSEIKEFNLAIDNYEKLGLVGICIYIDDSLAGFNFGSIISNDTYDGMVQKGDYSYSGIYELLNKETANLLKDRIKYMNFEEDLGIEGLRKAKLMYHPEVLLEKYIATEVGY